MECASACGYVCLRVCGDGRESAKMTVACVRGRGRESENEWEEKIGRCGVER